jgi:hypothetical protein
MVDNFFKCLFMTVVFNFWIWLGSKLWKGVEVDMQEDEDKAEFLASITFSNKENKKD